MSNPKPNQNQGQFSWFRRYPTLGLDRPKKKPDRASTPTQLKKGKNRRKTDLLIDVRELGKELGEVWDE